ncbi:WAS/WASL-interacting protein family member 1-like [Bos mutus]|uniref:WAS/WASL-interacting protein family member 1-like n=1 Tax=Bos mutus TaxID=72004 RepID=UPI0038B68C66
MCAPPLTSAHHTPDPRPATSSPTPRAGALPPGGSRPAFASSAFSPFGPAAPRERDDRRMRKGCLLGPGPFCGPFKSRPLNPFCSADRNCRPSPLRGRDQAAPSPTAAEPRAPSPPPGAGEGASEAVRPEKRQRRGEKENANGRRRTLPLPATLDQLRANLLSSPPRDPRGPTLGAAPLPPPSPAGTHSCCRFLLRHDQPGCSTE